MESTPDLLPPRPADPEAPSPGDLVVQNGRLSGVRRPLTVPLTLIGRTPSCHVRLNLDGIADLHCAILAGPTGLVLRDLESGIGTYVNGKAITTCVLHQDDLVSVGPFQFRIELGAGVEFLDPAALQAEREALRIQAAAVAAQQAAVTEEEIRLQQRRTALKRQEEQLAGHLEERRRQLMALQEQTRRDRNTLKADAAAARQEQEALRTSLAEARETAALAQQQSDKERRRLIELRKRLKRRWRKHWHVHEAALKRRMQEVAREADQLHKEAEGLRRERANLAQAQLRFNGEVELGRRQLHDEWQQLGLAQQQWEACLNREHAERERQARSLANRAAALAAGEQALAGQKRLWLQTHAHLQKDVAGLEARIRNQRGKLLEQEQELTRLGRALRPPEETSADSAPVPPAPPVPVAGDVELAPALKRLAGDLADQRHHLLEQWQRLLQVADAWRRERDAAVAGIEMAGLHIWQREQRVLAQEQALAAAAADLRPRQEALAQVRATLEGWHARLTAREAAWQSERFTLVAEAEGRERLAATSVQRVHELRRRWLERRRKEIEALRAARAGCEELRQHYTSLWQECQQRRATLAQEQRAVAAQALALERFRQEVVARADDSPGAERRLLRLERRSKTRIEAEEHDLARERKHLTAEIVLLEERTRAAHLLEQALARQREEWVRQQAEQEAQQAAQADAEERRRHDFHILQLQHTQDEQQLAALRDEVERIARLLIDEEEPVALPPSQAA